MAENGHPDVRLVLHGHFYQPPRENPWTEDVPVEPSAHPYHDWNERILAEAYRPNTASRVLDASGRIQAIVNNFEHLSFNVGPTLFAWLERRHADVAARIVAADRASAATRSGHGNAIAQAYNHAILPLCNERDRRTQVLWGLREFQHRFRRPAAGLWLPETAVHAGTVEALIDCGVRFTVLSPYQARRVRALPNGPWEDASDGRIDPRRPYRILSARPGRDGGRRFLDVFFYDGPISRAVSFEHLLRSSEALADRLALAVDPAWSGPQIVSVAVDGETFGHHEPFGDMCLSALVSEQARGRGLRLTNYAEFLAEVQPAYEVELQPGAGGEGTAWSCAHGVGRWLRDCGCSTGAPPGWNQQWRAPLRAACDGLRDRVAALFEARGARVFHDPWAARDDYIDLLLRPDDAAVAEGFFARHLRAGSDHAHRVQARKLLEAQRHAMAMYTSCGWFFADLIGIETLQNLRYAARCLQLAQGFTTEDLEGSFLTALAQARSNNGRDTGATLYRDIVQPDVLTARRATNAHAIFHLLDPDADGRRIYGFTVRDGDAREFDLMGHRARRGHLWLRHGRTTEETEISYLALEYSPRNLRCFMLPADAEVHARIGDGLDVLRPPLERADLERCLTALYGGPPLGIGDLLDEERLRIARRLAAGRVAGLRQQYRAIFADSTHLLEDFTAMHLELPQEIRVPCEFTLQADLEEAVAGLVAPIPRAALQDLVARVLASRRLGLRLDLTAVARCLGAALRDCVRQLAADARTCHLETAADLLQTSEQLGLALQRAEAEDLLHAFLAGRVVPALESPQADVQTWCEAMLRFAERLNFAVGDLRARLHASAAAGGPSA